MRILNTLYVDDHAVRLTVRRESIEIRKGRSLAARFPMATLDQVILTGRAEVTTETLGRCTRQGIRVASLHRSGRVRFTVGGADSGNVLLRVLQLRAADDRLQSDELARSFVAGKLQNHARLIRRWAWDATGVTRVQLDEQRAIVEERLGQLPGARDGDHIRGLEGDATRRYFKALGIHLEAHHSRYPFTQRTRQPPRDQVNALFSYLYGLLTVELVGAATAVGLDPQIGYLHGLRPGRPSLALDLIEEFRPGIAERFAVGLLTRQQLNDGDFDLLPGGACYLSDTGRAKLLRLWERYRNEEVVHPLLRAQVPRAALPTIQATLLARHLRGDLPTYAPYIVDR